jgi:hypothetical protein
MVKLLNDAAYRQPSAFPTSLILHPPLAASGAGCPITVTALLRICEVFELPMSKLVQGLDAEGVYEKLEPVLLQRRHRS